jgi:hypothetical protein
MSRMDREILYHLGLFILHCSRELRRNPSSAGSNILYLFISCLKSRKRNFYIRNINRNRRYMGVICGRIFERNCNLLREDNVRL